MNRAGAGDREEGGNSSKKDKTRPALVPGADDRLSSNDKVGTGMSKT